MVDEVRGAPPGPQGELARRLRLRPRLHPPRRGAPVQPAQRPGARLHRDEGREPEASDGPVPVPAQYQSIPPSLSRSLWNQEERAVRALDAL